ncbi:MAG: hypothetical protein NT133_00750 [Alphaproteobacteria bacterium]|nr:hypothetical protein [Alphaproteobacteria bacterium]
MFALLCPCGGRAIAIAMQVGGNAGIKHGPLSQLKGVRSTPKSPLIHGGHEFEIWRNIGRSGYIAFMLRRNILEMRSFPAPLLRCGARTQAPRTLNFANISGAVFHFRGPEDPYFKKGYIFLKKSLDHPAQFRL